MGLSSKIGSHFWHNLLFQLGYYSYHSLKAKFTHKLFAELGCIGSIHFEHTKRTVDSMFNSETKEMFYRNAQHNGENDQYKCGRGRNMWIPFPILHFITLRTGLRTMSKHGVELRTLILIPLH